MRKAVIYSCIGIDMEGRKSLFGYYIFYGTENKESWLKILNDAFYTGLSKLRFSNNYESALAEFEKLCERFQKKYLGYIKMLIEKRELFGFYEITRADKKTHLYNKYCRELKQ